MAQSDYVYSGGGISDAEKVAEARKDESKKKKAKREAEDKYRAAPAPPGQGGMMVGF